MINYSKNDYNKKDCPFGQSFFYSGINCLLIREIIVCQVFFRKGIN